MADEITKQASSSLNTLLLGITIAVMATVGAMSLNNAISLGRIEAGQITRPEIETKLADIHKDQIAMLQEANLHRLKLVELELRLKSVENK